MIKKWIKVNGMTCANCAKTIENSVMGMYPDVTVRVNVSAGKVLLIYDEAKYNLQQFIDLIKMSGYEPVTKDVIENAKQNRKKMKTEILIALLVSLPLLYSMFGHLKWFEFLYVPPLFKDGIFQLITAGIVQFGIGFRFYKGAYKALKQKVLGMDILVVLGTTSAYVYSLYLLYNQLFVNELMHPVYYFEISALIITMVLIGNYIEHIAKEKTTDALVELVNLGAKEAVILKDGKEVKVKIEDVKVNDLMVVLPSQKIPTDGVVVEGISTVDESMLTGESLGVKKEKNKEVFGATINLSSRLIIKATKVGKDTMLSQIIEAVEEASAKKPPIQRTADKIASVFVPIVVLIAIINFVIWFVILNSGFTAAFETTIAILVISCPCALGLATPTSVLVGNGMAAKNHILYKGGEFFELASKINVVCFDKTGTLTTGKPTVTDFVGDKSTLQFVYSLQKQSTHPISYAVINYCKDKNLKELKVTKFKEIKGKGLTGVINKQTIYIGSLNLVKELKIDYAKFIEDYNKLVSQAKTTNFVVVNDEVKAIYAVADKIKPSAKNVINEMKKRGITPVMITGDNALTAKAVANELGIENFYAEVLPQQKGDIVTKLQQENKVVAFVGDGINDAPALKLADVGMAMGSGTDVAINSSDVTLMTNNLGLVINAIELSRATLKNIYQNFFWAFSYNLIAIPLAATGQFSMAVAAAAMSFSSITVVLNALRLKRVKITKFNKGGNMKKIIVNDISCNHCVMSITKALNNNEIKDFNVDLETKTVSVKPEDLEIAKQIIKDAGYTPE